MNDYSKPLTDCMAGACSAVDCNRSAARRSRPFLCRRVAGRQGGAMGQSPGERMRLPSPLRRPPEAVAGAGHSTSGAGAARHVGVPDSPCATDPTGGRKSLGGFGP
jgi:hypothetical protein